MRLLIIFLILFNFDSVAQKNSKSLFNNVEFELDYLVNYHSFNYSRHEPLKHLNESNDKAGLLNDEYTPNFTDGITGASYLTDDNGPSISTEASTIALRAYTQLPFVNKQLIIGVFLKLNINSIPRSSSFDRLNYLDDYPGFNYLIFVEKGKMDTVSLTYYNYNYDRITDTIIVPRTKLVRIQNPSNSIKIGFSLKPVIYQTKSSNFRILGLFDFGLAISTSRKIKISVNYFDYEGLNSYEGLSGAVPADYTSSWHQITLLNSENRPSYIYSLEAPTFTTTSIAGGLRLDFKISKKLPIRIGINSLLGFGVFTRNHNVVGNKAVFSIGTNLTYTLN